MGAEAAAADNRVIRDIEPGAYRAEFIPSSVDQEKRTVDLIWTTGARVLRRTWLDGDHYEELSLEPGHVRMGRLESGRAPLLNAHNAWDLADQVGVVISARLEKGQGVATVRFPSPGVDEDADKVWRKVADGICGNVSVGYRTYKSEETREEGKLPVFRAVDWEPYELSLVPMGADAGASVRARSADPNPCEFIRLNQETTMAAKKNQNDPQGGAPAPATPPATEEREGPTDSSDAEARAAAEAKRAERKRITEIRTAARHLGLEGEIVERALEDDTSADEFRQRAIEEIAKRQEKTHPGPGGPGIDVGEDLTRQGAREGVRNALLHRGDPGRNELTDSGRAYRGMSLLDMARHFHEAHGVKVRGLNKRELAGVALGLEVRAGMHSTSDFPLILADVVGKSLRRSYDEAPQTFQPWARRTTLPDFREVKRTQFGEAPQLVKVPEGAEYTYGSIGEGREVYALATYGRIFAVTRETLINDDLDALQRIPMLYGRSARDLESDLVYAHFLSNPAMGDGVVLFHTDHGNVGTGTISIANVGAGRKAMRKQKGVDGKQRINVQAKFLLVPAALETEADQFVSTNFRADQQGNINPFAGRLQSIAEPRLDDTSELEWYLAADPAAIDTLEYGYLEGEEGVAVEHKVGFETDGLQVKARLDFGVKVIDHRGFYRSSGA